MRNVQFASRVNGLPVHQISNVEDEIYVPVSVQEGSIGHSTENINKSETAQKTLQFWGIRIVITQSPFPGKESLWRMLRYPRVMFVTITFYLTTMANVLLYYMLKFSAENISSSPYLSCWLLAASDLPSAFLIHFCAG